MIQKVKNWGNYPVLDCDIKDIRGADTWPFTDKSKHFIMRGMGRSYGDASLGENIISGLRQNCMISFDDETGILVAESGLTLAEILEVFIPRGFFLPVTPGTKYVTLGGAVASDVHGKNHHIDGSFCDHVEYIELLTPDSRILKCSVKENSDWFHLSRGGMGLTGIILKVALKLKKIETSWIRQRSIKARNFSELCTLFEQYKNAAYSVAWVDCLAKGKYAGRSILYLGEHVSKIELENVKGNRPAFQSFKKPKFSIPFYLPEFALSNFSVKVFNFLFYNKQFTRDSESFIPYEPFFYPLDSISGWNKIYGKRGFVQYQCVLPFAGGAETMQILLDKISHKGFASFLAVLKVFGKQEGALAFPMEGYTLALDFPVSHKLLGFLEELDQIVLAGGGRLYLAKDARMSAAMFEESYQNSLTLFRDKLNDLCPQNPMQSAMSERLNILKKI